MSKYSRDEDQKLGNSTAKQIKYGNTCHQVFKECVPNNTLVCVRTHILYTHTHILTYTHKHTHAHTHTRARAHTHTHIDVYVINNEQGPRSKSKCIIPGL